VVVLDFGASSVGGYAVFTVTARTGQPVVRLAYANHPDGLAETGDFTRETSARYLGPSFDLPILPANINRHELYTIPRTGRFIAPLIQGQARYVRVQLDSPGTSVDIDAVALVNSGVYDRSPNDGCFLCSDERINRLWAISAWTLQIASFPNHDAWKTVDGWLLPRKLEMADDLGLSKVGAAWADATVETVFELRTNPHAVSAAGVAFRAQDARNAYIAQIGLDSTFRLIRRRCGKDAVISEKRLAAPIVDGERYRLAVDAHGARLTTRLNGAVIDETTDDLFAAGRVGFYTPKESWPLFDFVHVIDGEGRTLLSDDFSGDLAQWSFARTLPYVADGAKRDRLVWSGDLYFAQRNVYYASAHPTYLRGALDMLAFNQTPEGYVQASPYPERGEPPALGEYGPFPSDEFAAWLVPVAWEHLLYTDDVATLRTLWPAIDRLLGYLRTHISADGLFVQRLETSKHAGNLNLGDTRERAYMHVLLWGVFTDAALIADRLGLSPERTAAQATADALRRVLYARFWDEQGGYFREALETPTFGFEANALALSMGLVTREQALRIAPRLTKVNHGKFQSLASRGKFEYGFGQSGLQALFDHNWLKLLDPTWQGAATTTECMGMITRGWGDESHPDTAIADHFSAYLLGVRPIAPGFSHFIFRPLPVQEVSWAKGVVPTPHGPITAGWELAGDALRLSLTVPRGTRADVVLPAGGTATVNGRPGSLCDLAPGIYAIDVRGLPAGAWRDPTFATKRGTRTLVPTVRTSSSREGDGWSAANLFAPAATSEAKGYASSPHPSAAASEWIEIDLGAETALSKLVLEPCAGGEGFPRDVEVQLAKQTGAWATAANVSGCALPGSSGLSVDLYTVIGYPTARYIRLAVSRLNGAVASDGLYRLQLRRIRVVEP
jgi:alpha-L-rhamnosidase